MATVQILTEDRQQAKDAHILLIIYFSLLLIIEQCIIYFFSGILLIIDQCIDFYLLSDFKDSLMQALASYVCYPQSLRAVERIAEEQ